MSFEEKNIKKSFMIVVYFLFVICIIRFFDYPM